jgi:quercetin dioxygenase-like cupin family protein
MSAPLESGALPPALPTTLAELQPYVDGSVISRTLLKRGKGNLTLFSFAAGQGLSEHTAPFDAFVHVLDGRARVTIGGQPLTVSAGQAVLMPANVPHALHADEPFKMLLVMIRE